MRCAFQAISTAAARSPQPSLAKMLLTWVFTVFSLTKRRFPIWALLQCSAISRSTSSSRVVRLYAGGLWDISVGSSSDSPAATARMALASSSRLASLSR